MFSGYLVFVSIQKINSLASLNHGNDMLSVCEKYAVSDVVSQVAALISPGAAPGPVTYPTTEFPCGRTPANLASSKGHKGIACHFVESSLTSQLFDITLKESSKDGNAPGDEQTVAERTATKSCDYDLQDSLWTH